MAGFRAWLLRRDPGLRAVRRAVRVAIVASVVFYACQYLADNAVMATYALFAVVAMGFLSQIPGPAVRRATTLLWSVPVACVLVTVGSLLAGNVWAATAGVFLFGFLISYAGVGGPRLVGLTAGMQLFFILSCFPPYAPDTIVSRLAGLSVGLGLLALAEQVGWRDPDPVAYEARLADAGEGIADHLAARAAGDPGAEAATLAIAEKHAEAIRPALLPPEARPASASRHDRALSHAGSSLRFALARLREMPIGMAAPTGVAELLDTSAETADAAAGALRGGPPPETDDLATAFSELLRERRERRLDAQSARVTALSLAAADGVWAMATAVRVARGVPIESGHGNRSVRRERFPYAYASPVRLWWQRFAVHLTPRSVYFQAAVRVAIALAAARLVAGVLDLSHGFWVLLATLTLLRSRAADTRIALRSAVVGTVAGAALIAAMLVVIGSRTEVYVAILPPVMVVAFAAGALLGVAWSQALFTVVITIVFTQLAPVGVELAAVRLLDVFVGAALGVTAGVLAWPRGAAGELRRSMARLLAVGGEAVRETARVLTVARPPPSLTDASAGAIPRVRDAMVLADASYSMYQTERHAPKESTVDWQAVIVAGQHIMRGSELLRDTYPPGSLERWRPLVTESAARVDEACVLLANALYEGRDPRVGPVEIAPGPDPRVVDVQVWLAGVADDLSRVRSSPSSSI